VPGFSWIVSNYNHSRYETQPLEEALVEAFSGDQYLFGGQRKEVSATSAKVAVTSTSAAGTAVVLANYNRLCSEKLPYQFYRPEKQSGELKTWEAARATSAAPTYFKALCHEKSKQVFWDGGVYHNNPINIAERERKLIWPDLVDQEPDVVVSIGTLYCSKTKTKQAAKWVPSTTGIVAHLKILATMASDHLHTSLDSQRTWDDFVSVRGLPARDQCRYVRLNPELDVQPPKLDDVDKLQYLQEETRRRIGGDQRLKRLARRLLATCFYFDDGELRDDPTGSHFEVEGQCNTAIFLNLFPSANPQRLGYFRCRLTERSEIEGLGKLIKRFANAGHAPFFFIAGAEGEPVVAQSIEIDDHILDRMIRGRDMSSLFRMRKVFIKAASRAARTAISLCLTQGTNFPISGFPRCLHVDQSDAPGLPGRAGLTNVGSIRWASRSGSQRQRRLDWTPPYLPPPLMKEDIMARYSNADYLLGSATSLMSVTNAFAAHATTTPNAPVSAAELHAKPSSSANIRGVQQSSSEAPQTGPRTDQAHELPAKEKARHELPVIETVHELSNEETVYELGVTERDPHTTFWLAEEDWAGTWGRGPENIYLELVCGDILEVLELRDNGKDSGLCRVLRPSDGREGWVPQRCLSRFKRVVSPPYTKAADERAVIYQL
jgi:hypothetical protein